MKTALAVSAAALLSATGLQAQVLGPGPGAGQTGGQPAGVSASGAGVFGGQVGTPLGTPQTATGVNIGPDALKTPDPSADPARGAVNGVLQPQTATSILDARAQAKGAVDDSRTLNAGDASVPASATVSTRLQIGQELRTARGERLGRITGVGGTSVTVEGADGVRHTVPAQGLTVSGSAAVTYRSSSEFNALPRAK